MLEEIYDKMKQRNYAWLAENVWRHDPLLSKQHSSRDHRRCVAVVAEGHWEEGRDWHKIKDFLQQCLESGKWISPVLHHTFICLRPWGYVGSYDNPKDLEEFNTVKEILETKLKGGYQVFFDRVLPVSTGFVLCGRPSIDINQIRSMLREEGFVQGERYLLDICHMTLLRNISKVTQVEQKHLLKLMQSDLGEKGDFLTLSVNSMHICESSWCMRESEYKIYTSINLESI